MSGTPGLGVNDPEGFANIVTPDLPLTIAVNQSAGDVPIPLSVLPFWRNDGGFRSYGGATVISVFDAAGIEGVSSADIPAITDQPISAQGTFQVSNPDAQKLYRIIVRIRSAANDPNFRDFICVFRLITPLEVPIEYTKHDTADIPTPTYTGVDFFWDMDAPVVEIRLRDGTGGIQLPNLAATAWPAAAKAYMLRQLQDLRDGVLMLDFYAGAGVSASTRRQLYHYYWDGAAWVFAKIRHRDFPAFDPYSGSDLGVAQATIDLGGGSANLDFNYNAYVYGQRFESFIVVGPTGFLNVDPKAILAGGTIDISSIVDFSIQNLFHRFDLTDQYITIIASTEEKIVYRQIPLWPTSTDLVTIDNDKLVPGTTTPVPTEILRARLVTWPWIEFPNLSNFLTVPPGGVGADPAGTIYPDLLTINLYDGLNPVPVATYTDEVDLWNNMVELQLPNQGLTIPVLDVRALLTPTSPFFRIEADVRTALSAPGTAYKYIADFPLNANGEPEVWERDDVVLSTIFPTFEFDEWGKVKVTWPATVVSFSTPITFTGDVGSLDFAAPAGPFPVTVEYDLRNAVISRKASYFNINFNADDGGGDIPYEFRVPTIVKHQQLIGPTDIDVFFAGNVIVFPTGSLAVVDVTFPVTFIGDVGQVELNGPSENVPYFTGQLGDGGERIFSNPLHPFVDVDFTNGGGTPCRVRIPNTFYDIRQAKKETFAVASRAHGPTSGGLASAAFDFSVPNAKINLGTGEIEFEDDGSGFAWNFASWQVILGKTLRRQKFTGTISTFTPYNISAILPTVALKEYVFVVFKHSNGFQRVAAYKITNNFEKALRVEIDAFV